MKSLNYAIFSAIVLSLGSRVGAQSTDDFKPTRIRGLANVPAEATDLGVDPEKQARHFRVPLDWKTRSAKVVVYVSNDHPAALDILGVQSSMGVYISDFPKQIPANGQAKISIIWAGQEGTTNAAEFVRVLTPVGEKIVSVEVQKQQMVSLDTQELLWNVGQSADAKIVNVSCVAPVALISATAAGKGNTATVEAVGSGKYVVKVTPASTSRSTLFPVILRYSEDVTGLPSVIRCVITE